MRQFRRDVPTTPDQQAARRLGQAHDRVGRLVIHRGEIGLGRDEGPCPRRQHDDIARDRSAVDLEAARPAEAGLALVHGHVREALAILLTGGGDGIDAPENPLGHLGPPHLVEACGDAKASGAARRLGHVGHVHQHLGGNATPVETGPPEVAALHDRHTPVRQLRRQQRVARTCPDDDKIEVRHDPTLKGWRLAVGGSSR